jgi:hypothetical protein
MLPPYWKLGWAGLGAVAKMGTGVPCPYGEGG